MRGKSQLNILAIDTATSTELIAAISDEKSSDKTRHVNVSHSATLMTGIDHALKDIDLKIKDIDLIGAGIGPGSFTGIRITVATARMISQIYNIPVIGVNTQLFYAYSASDNAGHGEYILVAFDAKKEKVFGALYRKNTNKRIPDVIVRPGDHKIISLLEHVDPGKNTLLIGDGCLKYKNDIEEKIKKCMFLDNYLPPGRNICMLIRELYEKNPERYTDYTKLLPHYSRKSDAEIIRDQAVRE